VPRSSNLRDPVRLVAFYHRPLEDPFHGGSLHFRGFVDGLRLSVPVATVAPRLRGRTGPDERVAPARIVGVRYLLLSMLEGWRFLVRSRGDRGSRYVLIAFDVYVAGIVALIAQLRRAPVVYYPQDLNEDVTRSWRAENLSGSLLFRMVRGPLERAGVGAASVILVPSESMREQWTARRRARAPVLVCHLNRNPPVFRPDDVARWRAELGADQRMVAVFVGSFQYPPNVEAFQFLQGRLAPQVAQRDRGILFVVAGLDSEPFVSLSTSNLRVLGTVGDLDGLLYAADVGLAPMGVSGGTSGKIVDYVLHGLDVVATPEAARGVQATPRLRVEDLARFSEVLVEIHRMRTERAADRAPRPIDPAYVSSYMDNREIRSIARELVGLRRDVAL
jgi:hypothetical protein